jgi:two-component system cell cycle sensor histidine kinase/response regulator CckA
MLRELGDDEPLADSVKAMRAASRRASDLTRQLLAFSRRQLMQLRVLDLNAAIRESTKMLRRLLSEDVELLLELDPELNRVKADSGQLDQILLNLAVNAKDAMPRGGRLTITTRNVAIGDDEAQRHASFQPGHYVMLAVTDNGVGIEKDVLPYIFEPFYTTKEPGKGTGLGLSTVYGIVKQSGGWIWVSSDIGRGTTLKIYLPPVDAPVASNAAPVEGENPRGSETVLVVEDEDSVRTLTCRVLRAHGYHVVEAANGHAALVACEAHQRPIPLLITDVVMPRMSGPELAARLKQRRPDLKVLYISGYADAAVVEHRVVEPATWLLQKPFSPGDLTRKVRDVLDHEVRGRSADGN